MVVKVSIMRMLNVCKSLIIQNDYTLRMHLTVQMYSLTIYPGHLYTSVNTVVEFSQSSTQTKLFSVIV